MASMRVIKNRIRSVKNTEQITLAMKLVSASKLQRAKTKLLGSRPFFHETQQVVADIVENSKGVRHPYLTTRPVNKILIVLITSDRGLCGGYNNNVAKEARNLIRGKTAGALIIVGTKGRDFFIRRRKTILRTMVGASENPFYADAADIGGQVLECYKSGEYDKVFLVYTQFASTISYVPQTVQLLPVDTDSFAQVDENEKTKKQPKAIMNYEPDAYAVLDYVIPKYVNTMIYGALVESAACQQAARMTSMDAATENAIQMIDKLTLNYNRARQGAITQELTEIVSGANALNDNT